MDSVRFGRVLGVGARLAGKTLAEAIDAAAAPDPRGKVIPPPQRTAAVKARRETRAVAAEVKRGGRQFGGAVARASGVLWLEVTGVFFGLVMVAGLDAMWLNRGAVRWGSAGPDVREHFLLGVGLAAVFGYFCVSSFVRASWRGKG